MATLAVQKVTLNGLGPSFVAASVGGDEFINTGRVMLYVKNGGASAVDVTINSQTQCNYGFDHDVVVSIPAGGERIVGPFPKTRFDDANGKVQIAYSDVTSITVAAIELP